MSNQELASSSQYRPKLWIGSFGPGKCEASMVTKPRSAKILNNHTGNNASSGGTAKFTGRMGDFLQFRIDFSAICRFC